MAVDLRHAAHERDRGPRRLAHGARGLHVRLLHDEALGDGVPPSAYEEEPLDGLLHPLGHDGARPRLLH